MPPFDFSHSTRGETDSNPDSFQNNLISLILQADSLHERANNLTFSLAQSGNHLYTLVENIPFGLEGISCASYYLNGAVNSLLSLRIMTIEEIVDSPEKREVIANLTPHGTAGLLRQTLECGAKAHWMMHASSLEEFKTRSFAALWENGRQSISYANAIDSPDREAKREVLKELTEDGLNRGLIKFVGGKPQPIRNMLPATDILREISFRELRFGHLVKILGTNVHSGAWMYSWLSGMAHGLVWSHADTPYEGSPDTNIVTTVPDVMRLGLSAALAIEIIEDTFEAFASPIFNLAAQ